MLSNTSALSLSVPPSIPHPPHTDTHILTEKDRMSTHYFFQAWHIHLTCPHKQDPPPPHPFQNAYSIIILVGLHQSCKYIFNGPHWHILPISVPISKMSGKHGEGVGGGGDSKHKADSITHSVCLEMILCFLHQWILCRACSYSHHSELLMRQWSDAIDTPFVSLVRAADGIWWYVFSVIMPTFGTDCRIVDIDYFNGSPWPLSCSLPLSLPLLLLLWSLPQTHYDVNFECLL